VLLAMEAKGVMSMMPTIMTAQSTLLSMVIGNRLASIPLPILD
jgi:hypothetical protein